MYGSASEFLAATLKLVTVLIWLTTQRRATCAVWVVAGIRVSSGEPPGDSRPSRIQRAGADPGI